MSPSGLSPPWPPISVVGGRAPPWGVEHSRGVEPHPRQGRRGVKHGSMRDATAVPGWAGAGAGQVPAGQVPAGQACGWTGALAGLVPGCALKRAARVWLYWDALLWPDSPGWRGPSPRRGSPWLLPPPLFWTHLLHHDLVRSYCGRLSFDATRLGVRQVDQQPRRALSCLQASVPAGNRYTVTAVSPRGVSKQQQMATRYSFSLAHAGCDHSGTIILEERGEANTARDAGPVVMSLPRGFVNLNVEAGAIEIVCVGCRQTVAAAARAGAAPSVDPPDPGHADPGQANSDQADSGQAGPGQADPEREAKPMDAAVSGSAVLTEASECPASDEQHAVGQNTEAPAAEVVTPKPAEPDQAPHQAPDPAGDTAASSDQDSSAASADAASDDKLQADIEALFAEAKDVAPIRGDAIPSHLLDRLRHLADRMRQRRE